MPQEIEVKIGSITIEEGKLGKIELIYIPDQTQVFKEGRSYKFVLEIKEGEKNEPT